MNSTHTFTKQLDSYSLLIVSKFFETVQDYINIICVCKKFKETTEKLRYNPIPIKTLTLFPKIQTQYIYSTEDQKIKEIEHFDILFEVDYDEYLKLKSKNIKCHHVSYDNPNASQKEDPIIQNIVLPEGVNMLQESFFSNYEANSITIPNSITDIGDKCFFQCTNLTNIELPKGLTNIKIGGLRGCASLKQFIIPDSVQSIGDYCFYGCNNLQMITIPDTVKYIGKCCFHSCRSLESIIIPSIINEIKSDTFNNCWSLNNIQLSTSLTSIGPLCFYQCLNLKSINLPPSLKHIGTKGFFNCGLQSVEIPKIYKI